MNLVANVIMLCTATRRDGKPCEMAPIKGGTLCMGHDPAVFRRRGEARHRHRLERANEQRVMANREAWRHQRGMFYETAVARVPLQGRLLGRMQRDKLTLAGVQLSGGPRQTTISEWFRVQDRALTEVSLRLLAAFLGIDYDRALQEAGGKTGEDVWREKGRANKRHLPKTKAARRETGAKGGAITRELYRSGALVMTEAHRQAVRAGKAAKPVTLTTSRTNLNKVTLRGRAQSLVGGLRRAHPAWSREQVEAEAARRLTETPYGMGDIRVARALVSPRPRRSPTGRPRKIDYYKITEWRCGPQPRPTWADIASEIGEDIGEDIDPDTLADEYSHWLSRFQIPEA